MVADLRGFFGSRRDYVAERVAEARARREAQGHELTPLQEGIVASLAAHAADQPDAAETIAAIRQQIDTTGRWSDTQEWRISTWFENEIVRRDQDGIALYTVTVRCDGQNLSCEGPSLERVFAFMHLYQAIILQGFYSAGPPWAE